MHNLNDVEVLGQEILGLLEGFKTFRSIGQKLLKEEGLVSDDQQIEPERWYSAEAWHRASKRIAKEMGDAALYQTGLAVGKIVHLVPGLKNVRDVVNMIDVGYHMHYRKGGARMFDPATGRMLDGIGHYRATLVEGKSLAVIECDSVHPSEMDRGIIHGLCAQFTPSAQVVLDATKPSRKNGADQCVYLVTWAAA